jgi:hypothetical protein
MGEEGAFLEKGALFPHTPISPKNFWKRREGDFIFVLECVIL